MEAESRGQEVLLNSAIAQYKAISGMTQNTAEEFYINIVMQLEGYGYETFTAKVNIINNINVN